MLYEVLGDIWVVRRNPYLQDDLLDNPKRRKQLIDALNHRVGEIDRRREPGTPAEAGHDPQRDEEGRESAGAGAFRHRRLRGRVRPDRHAAQAAQKTLGRITARDSIRFDGLSRVSRMTDATDWRVSTVRGADAGFRGMRSPRWSRPVSSWA